MSQNNTEELREFEEACCLGNLKKVESMTKTLKDYFCWGDGLCFACVFGHVEIVRFLLNLSAPFYSSWSRTMSYACYGENEDIIELIFSAGYRDTNHPFDLNRGMNRAIVQKKMKIVKYLTEKKFLKRSNIMLDVNVLFLTACQSRNLEAMKFLVKKGRPSGFATDGFCLSFLDFDTRNRLAMSLSFSDSLLFYRLKNCPKDVLLSLKKRMFFLFMNDCSENLFPVLFSLVKK